MPINFDNAIENKLDRFCQSNIKKTVIRWYYFELLLSTLQT